MLFVVVSILVPLATWFLVPALLRAMGRGPSPDRWPLALAGFCFFISWYLPSPLIQGRDTAFTTHFLGGGVYAGFVWLYLRESINLGPSAPWETASLYALVSSLGVANELFELLVVQLGLVRLDPADTWWDLLANTSAALLFWLCYRAYAAARAA